MAYPTVDRPYGFQPVNRIGGTPYAGSTRLIHCCLYLLEL